MTNPDKPQFTILRSILHALGLPDSAVDDIIGRILDWLSDKDEGARKVVEFPYQVRDDFLSRAEQSFYLVLRTAVSDWALICPKVSLGDLFFAKSSDPSEYRVATNRIDRKHVDFLLCDPRTAKPLLGVELDDKTHERADRRERDQFVEEVFQTARLPLVRVPVQRSYAVAELATLLREKAGAGPGPVTAPVEGAGTQEGDAQPPAGSATTPPRCPKCGSAMVLRTARTGAKQGSQFWDCSNYPRCRGILSLEGDSNAARH